MPGLPPAGGPICRLQKTTCLGSDPGSRDFERDVLRWGACAPDTAFGAWKTLKWPPGWKRAAWVPNWGQLVLCGWETLPVCPGFGPLSGSQISGHGQGATFSSWVDGLRRSTAVTVTVRTRGRVLRGSMLYQQTSPNASTYPSESGAHAHRGRSHSVQLDTPLMRKYYIFLYAHTTGSIPPANIPINSVEAW